LRDDRHRSRRKMLVQLAKSGDLDVRRQATWGMSDESFPATAIAGSPERNAREKVRAETTRIVNAALTSRRRRKIAMTSRLALFPSIFVKARDFVGIWHEVQLRIPAIASHTAVKRNPVGLLGDLVNGLAVSLQTRGRIGYAVTRRKPALNLFVLGEVIIPTFEEEADACRSIGQGVRTPVEKEGWSLALHLGITISIIGQTVQRYIHANRRKAPSSMSRVNSTQNRRKLFL